MKKMYVKLMKRMLKLLLLMLVLAVDNAAALPHEKDNLSQTLLPNGMKLWVKQTAFDPQQVYVTLTAPGGYALVPPEDRVSIELIPAIAWESGVNGLNSDQLTALFHDRNIEFTPKIYPYKRSIEGMCKTDDLKLIFQCVQGILTKQQINEEGVKRAKDSAKRAVQKLLNDPEYLYQAGCLKVNTNAKRALQLMTVEEIDKVNIDKCIRLYADFFLNPKDFAIIVVGDIDPATVKNLANRYLATIAKREITVSRINEKINAFPPGTTSLELTLPKECCLKDTVTQLTFPWQSAIGQDSISEIAIACQIVKTCMKKILKNDMKATCGIDVAYEFPYYPLLSDPWVSIKFRCLLEEIPLVKGRLISLLKRMQEEGLKEEELCEIKELERSSCLFSLNDNFFWVSTLANYYLWGFDPLLIERNQRFGQDLTGEQVKSIFKRGVSLDHYSEIKAKGVNHANEQKK